ncbi:hypothetical protein NE237_001004 [Protea cynaroides]|uniref:Uncharacterized protein n=1 Tax=Protea cynaroides TaxID=273540 RepID=A0A9Q0QXQ2_9MAGN|nr:hypothetical protein NE237_001004 [Protea cynaroides]
MPILLKDLLANVSSTYDLANQVSDKVPDSPNLVSIARYYASMPLPAPTVSPPAPTPAPSVATQTPVPFPQASTQPLSVFHSFCCSVSVLPSLYALFFLYQHEERDLRRERNGFDFDSWDR